MKKENLKEMDIVFLLDRSGSMGGMEEDTIGGYNSYLKEQKNKKARVTTILFDNEYEILHQREDIKKVKELTKEEYYVRGCTALLDAIGKTINLMDHEKAKKVIFIITTDGLENASREFNKDQIKEMIKKHCNWEFMYIGANIDSYQEGETIGIKRNNISNYCKSKKGVEKLFSSLGKASESFYDNACVCADWKDDLENFIDDNMN